MRQWVFVSRVLPSRAFNVLRFESTESLSQLWEATIEVEATGGAESVQSTLDAVLGGPAYLAATGTDERKMLGIAASVELLPRPHGVRPAYRIVLVPGLSVARWTRRSRVFLDVTVADVARRIFGDMGLVEGDDKDFTLKLTLDYPRREYVVQYEESDLAFLTRWLEHEGIALRFDHGVEREHIVLSDTSDGMRPSLGEVSLHDATTAAAEGRIVELTQTRTRQVPGKVVIVDYDWRKPQLTLLAEASVPGGLGSVFTGSTHFVDQAYGNHLAMVRAQEALCDRDVYRGKSTIPGLQAGDRFTLRQHFHPELDGEYLVVQLRRRVAQSVASSPADDSRAPFDDFLALRAETTYRPRRDTPRPRIDGVLYATIDGPGLGVPAPIDARGQYKVILPFDVAAEGGGKCSRWIRMAQPLSGPNFGVHFPLREGADVLLAHVEGDPDRPVIVGTVPNAVNTSPVTAANPTQSIIRTFTGITVEFEDDA